MVGALSVCVSTLITTIQVHEPFESQGNWPACFSGSYISALRPSEDDPELERAAMCSEPLKDAARDAEVKQLAEDDAELERTTFPCRASSGTAGVGAGRHFEAELEDNVGAKPTVIHGGIPSSMEVDAASTQTRGARAEALALKPETHDKGALRPSGSLQPQSTMSGRARNRARQRLGLGSIASQARRYHKAIARMGQTYEGAPPSSLRVTGMGSSSAPQTPGLSRVMVPAGPRGAEWIRSRSCGRHRRGSGKGSVGSEYDREERVRKMPQLSAEFIPRPGMTIPDDNLVKQNGDLAEWSNEMQN
ncbi:hypothetical protein DFH09DRAFT_1085664 [Mycena vulgaris]|nr:hypothetical protein DFH09DRAFT_1085664 [Mycena vulgaris]